MKKLEEFVREELDEFLPQAIGGQVVITPQEIQEAKEKEQKTYERLRQDPALAILAKATMAMVGHASKLPVPQEIRDAVVLQIFVRMITIWENANNAFNRQFEKP